MSRLFIAQVKPDLPAPDFGEAFAAHIAGKTHPEVRTASLAAWNLLARLLREEGFDELPQVAFSPTGKPYFVEEKLHFSLAHSGTLAAALLSDSPCGMDVQLVQPEMADKLRDRCLTETERALDFFECWTKKECIGKLKGSGIGAHPERIDTLDDRWAGKFFSTRIRDVQGQHYVLTALCDNAGE